MSYRKLGEWRADSVIHRLVGACSAVLLGMSLANAQEPVYDLDIPPQDAATSLEHLAEQTGAITLYRYDLAADQQANRVFGQYTLPQALDVLLEGTTLSGDLSNQRVISISNNGDAEYQQEDEEMQPDNTPLPGRIAAAVTTRPPARDLPEPVLAGIRSWRRRCR